VLLAVTVSTSFASRGARRSLGPLGIVAAAENTVTSEPTASARPAPTHSPRFEELISLDKGPYSDLASRVRVTEPSWLAKTPAELILDESSGFCFRYVQGTAVALCASGAKPTLRVANLSKDDDLDSDGIPTGFDILIGAKKTVLLRSPYVETYRALTFPNGDMPREEGVCTDVVVRALRNAGYDLQSLLSRDRASAPSAYPAIAKPDRNIDHRRVRNLLIYFKRHFESLPETSTLLPGDIVLFDTMGDSRPEHIGVVSDSVGTSGQPLIINSWTTGYITSEMDLLPSVPVTHRFRIRSSKKLNR